MNEEDDGDDGGNADDESDDRDDDVKERRAVKKVKQGIVSPLQQGFNNLLRCVHLFHYSSLSHIICTVPPQ